MPDNNTVPSSSSPSSISMPPPPNKKRKKSATIAPMQPTQVALPPPLIPYPPHLMPSYFPVYHQHPYFLSVGPQPPMSPSLSPTLSSTSSTATTTAISASVQRILPKSPTSAPTGAASPSTLTPSYNFYPYPMQISPQLHPTAHVPPTSPVPFGARQNSVSSTNSNSTADQREQARKVSHSAIERRRRERINDKILQLKDLIPSCSDRENLHKMTILQSAIDYITYLKKVIHDSPTMTEDANALAEPKKSTASSHIDQFTSQFSAHPVPNDDKSVESEEDTEVVVEQEEASLAMSTSNMDGSKTATTEISPVTPLPSSGLKPMDLIKLNKSANHSSSPPPPPPKIIVNFQEVEEEEHEETTRFNHTERNMNLENILC